MNKVITSLLVAAATLSATASFADRYAIPDHHMPFASQVGKVNQKLITMMSVCSGGAITATYNGSACGGLALDLGKDRIAKDVLGERNAKDLRKQGKIGAGAGWIPFVGNGTSSAINAMAVKMYEAMTDAYGLKRNGKGQIIAANERIQQGK